MEASGVNMLMLETTVATDSKSVDMEVYDKSCGCCRVQIWREGAPFETGILIYPTMKKRQ